MISGFVTDLIGIHAIFGGFVFGLIIPKEGQFAARLIERIEDFVSGLLLPLYFASSGLKTDVTKINGAGSWGLLALVIMAACSGKIMGTFIVAVLCKIPAREALTLGFLMNTKGLVELIVLNIGKEKKVLNDEAFAILVLMALFTTFITTPSVMTICKSDRDKLANSIPKLQEITNKDETRILACIHGPTNIPSIINFIESIRATGTLSHLKLYIMHLIELSERPSSIMLLQRLRKNGIPLINHLYGGGGGGGGKFYDQVLDDISFKNECLLGLVTVRNKTAVSPLLTMHEDICQMVQKKGVRMIILPFHKQWRGINGNEEIMENMGHGWRGVNQRVLMHAPCSVGILVNRELSGVDINIDSVKRVCILFFGGANDRVALNLGWRMAQHPKIKVTLIRFVEQEDIKSCDHKLRVSPPKFKEKELDDVTICEFRRKFEGIVEYMENVSGNTLEAVLTTGRSGYELVVVGKVGWPPSMVATDRQVEHEELGPIGDLLASPGQGIISSVLVVQEHDNKHTEDVTVSLMPQNDEDATANEPSNAV
ncbi:transporter [Lithospermum erythrorhizon]|uniref:Transporter n=1 Tax=Lithospermum erythrorhizon TaxID=34254 RepID=A0AAV3Q670_LITER